MTYVREQSSDELAAHMRSLQRMAGWFDPLADRLWQEVEKLKAEVARSTEREIHQLAEIEALRKNSDRYLHLKATWSDGGLIRHLADNVLPEDWDAEIDRDMGKEVKP
ncbi:hypothetical protein HK44_020290 [Pseudomonas fluorescens HK44]|uniref:Uncharacterized protein n=1 Tax=Pseudomonas fluorescens HK44 TaxID=1042209 RepID=A0A010RVJ0_PSEFL|nr:hypothetical protein [Pseudomonas fluorescens]EXF96261.1 hypothetical protein HK44_020290 [Pseudomonas fluorescens HK44]